MKKLMSFVFSVAFAVVAFAQTPSEIISRMENEVNRHENDGVAMTIDLKVPVVGTMTSRSYVIGDKMRLDATMLGKTFISWSDGVTRWFYNGSNNEIEIESFDEEEETSENNLDTFIGIADGYDVSIDKETNSEWHLLFKKGKSNIDKDAPKKKTLVVAKGSYFPIRYETKMNGTRIIIYDITIGVTEEQVTFDPKKYPDAKYVDKRKSNSEKQK